ncbi:MAG TPA: carboxypeptidase-like regulatory domain-containing protein, partial [Bacteroidia bacterium]|nr:carboxypeptidase-like regulatory domain-containing protein [Bacteroidia bacterium]
MLKYSKFHILTLLLVIFFPITFFGQTIVRGLVTDAKTGEPLPFVSVLLDGTTEGRNTDFNGQYFMETNST